MKCNFTSKGNIKIVISSAQCDQLNKMLDVLIAKQKAFPNTARYKGLDGAFMRELRHVPVGPAKRG